MRKGIECIVTGRVQMVLFRDFARRKARGLGLVGFVENMPDKSVHVVAEGEENALRAFIEYLRKGSFLARVTRVDVIWREPSGGYGDFTIRH